MGSNPTARIAFKPLRADNPRVAKLVNAVALGATGGNAFRVRIPARGPALLYANWPAKREPFIAGCFKGEIRPLHIRDFAIVVAEIKFVQILL